MRTFSTQQRIQAKSTRVLLFCVLLVLLVNLSIAFIHVGKKLVLNPGEVTTLDILGASPTYALVTIVLAGVAFVFWRLSLQTELSADELDFAEKRLSQALSDAEYSLETSPTPSWKEVESE